MSKRSVAVSWILPVIAIIGILGVTGSKFKQMHTNEGDEVIFAEEVKFLKRVCKPIGDSVDTEPGSRNRKRIIYQCPDGQTHIR